MESIKNQSSNRQTGDSERSNVKTLRPSEPASTNPFEQVNKFDHAQWNRIVEDISKLEVAKAVIRVMDERDSLKSLYPSIYVRAHQTCIAVERKAEVHARRIVLAKKIGVGIVALTRRAIFRVLTAVTHLSKSGQLRLF